CDVHRGGVGVFFHLPHGHSTGFSRVGWYVLSTNSTLPTEISSTTGAIMYRLLAITFLLAGCKPSYEDFAETFPDEICSWADTCTNVPDPAEDAYDCEGEVLDGVESLNGDDACEYDADAAKACLELLEIAECEDEAALYGDCGDVFTGDDCELDLTTLL
ncbi:MAG: hypothetical protein ACI8S6_000592, partial [Myxococcota bacterium]